MIPFPDDTARSHSGVHIKQGFSNEEISNIIAFSVVHTNSPSAVRLICGTGNSCLGISGIRIDFRDREARAARGSERCVYRAYCAARAAAGRGRVRNSVHCFLHHV